MSREILQKSKVLSIISKRLVRKALDMFSNVRSTESNQYRGRSNSVDMLGVVRIADVTLR